MKPIQIFVGGQELTQYTGGRLTRKKQDLTGSLTCDIFFNYMPSRPVMANAMAGEDVMVYVGGHLAFWGTLDKRRGKGKGKDNGGAGAEITSSINADHYDVQLTARGRTKCFIDSSHQHPTGTMLKPTNRQVVEALTKDFQVELDWQSPIYELPRVIFRDGCNIVHELHRIGNENAHYVYETRDGKLRFTDAPTDFGDDIVLGKNILTFSSDQSKEHDRDRIVVKGQRIDKAVWGEEAVVNVVQAAKKSGDQSRMPYTIQHYGDGSKDALERRAKFEADKRQQQNLKVSVEVFHVMSTTGPWDLGILHYVEIPPEGVFNVMECVELDYTFDAQGTLKTTLTLAPPPAPKDQSAQSDKANIGKQRRSQLGVDGDMDIWDPADLQFSPDFAQDPAADQRNFLGGVPINSPPLKIGTQ
jgi:prophage tail gpP-like protein